MLIESLTGERRLPEVRLLNLWYIESMIAFGIRLA
jgi:hypothetical protein